MWEAAVLVAFAAGTVFWADSLRARERALAAGRRACERRGLQLLDETVAFATLRLARNRQGRLCLKRIYTFEYSGTGNDRRAGAIVLLGEEVLELRIEPPSAQ